ncbi:hypothetical protein D9758_009195 [Tetrapyrgos nigripes]|uniref:C2H2-type domain-containing protein n=1 Tax=Tetrapyrgos nigripes TaxID=182062 RepID=A0A8H5FWB8_9AGAR|nr:hypothetical protein D9758_009195 [Tetrapyrgos nigripes]
MKFRDLRSLEEHFRGTPAQKHPKCPRCQSGFLDVKALEVHFEHKHPKIVCCGVRIYNDGPGLEEHYRNSPERKHPNCNRCGRQFFNWEALSEVSLDAFSPALETRRTDLRLITIIQHLLKHPATVSFGSFGGVDEESEEAEEHYILGDVEYPETISSDPLSGTVEEGLEQHLHPATVSFGSFGGVDEESEEAEEHHILGDIEHPETLSSDPLPSMVEKRLEVHSNHESLPGASGSSNTMPSREGLQTGDRGSLRYKESESISEHLHLTQNPAVSSRSFQLAEDQDFHRTDSGPSDPATSISSSSGYLSFENSDSETLEDDQLEDQSETLRDDSDTLLSVSLPTHPFSTKTTCGVRCDRCAREFSNPDSLKDHWFLSTDHPKCWRCVQGFNDDADLQKHLQHTDHGTIRTSQQYNSEADNVNEPGACGVVNEPWLNAVESTVHHHDANDHDLSCPRCRRQFFGWECLSEHFRSEHPVTVCFQCGAVMYENELEAHFQSSVLHPKCPCCKRGFYNSNALKEHFKTEHYKIECRCGLVIYKEEMQRHFQLSLRHPKCPRCHEGFLDLNLLNKTYINRLSVTVA